MSVSLHDDTSSLKYLHKMICYPNIHVITMENDDGRSIRKTCFMMFFFDAYSFNVQLHTSVHFFVRRFWYRLCLGAATLILIFRHFHFSFFSF